MMHWEHSCIALQFVLNEILDVLDRSKYWLVTSQMTVTQTRCGQAAVSAVVFRVSSHELVLLCCTGKISRLQEHFRRFILIRLHGATNALDKQLSGANTSFGWALVLLQKSNDNHFWECPGPQNNIMSLALAVLQENAQHQQPLARTFG